MGWRSWNLFGRNVNQTLLEQIQDAMVSRGRSVGGVPTSLLDLGYSDVGLDDAWQRVDSGPNGEGYHDKAGYPIIDLTTFPDMGAMVRRAHGLNLTAGWYGNNCISADMNTSVAHFIGDVATFRQLDFDGYKLDSCGGQKDIALWSNLLNSTGRPVVVENCHNGPYYPEPSYRPDRGPYCPFNFYRVSVDVEVLYASIFGVNLPAMLPFTKAATGTGTGVDAPLSYPGCWACVYNSEPATRAPTPLTHLPPTTLQLPGHARGRRRAGPS